MTAQHLPHKLSRDERRIAGRNILALLQTRDISIAEMARYMEVHRTYMSKMVAGKLDISERLEPISKYLNTSIEDLLSDSFAPTRVSTLPFGALDENGRQAVPNGCVLQSISDKTDSHPSAGKWVLLGPKTSKPPAGALVWCETLDGMTFVRQYVPDQRDPRRFVLVNNQPGDGPVALDHSQVADLRVVAIHKLPLEG